MPNLHLRTSLALGDTLVLSGQNFSIKVLTSPISFMSNLGSLPLKVHKWFVGSLSNLTLLFRALAKFLWWILRYQLMFVIIILSIVVMFTKAIVITHYITLLSVKQYLFLIVSKALAIVDKTYFRDSFFFFNFT